MGLNFSAIVFATLHEGNREAVAAFEAALSQIPQIVDAQRLFGEPDYLLHVVTQDLPAFQKLYDECLSGLPNVQRLTSTLVMKRVIRDRVLPLCTAAIGRKRSTALARAATPGPELARPSVYRYRFGTAFAHGE